MLSEEARSILKKGGVGVMPTDTLYGVVAAAFSAAAVELLYSIKGRNEKKPFIILISSLADLKKFNISLSEKERQLIGEFWPGPVSIILLCPDEKFSYLHRGSQSLAFRLPNDEDLRNLIKETGPLAAPSANPEGEPPAATIEEAKKYFGQKVDFYIDGGSRRGPPSKILRLKDAKLEVVR